MGSEALAQAAREARDGRVSRRILAIRHLLEGHGVEETVGLFAIGRTQLYAWTHRYNTEGLVGLRDRPRPGTPPHLRTADEAAFRARVIAGPPAGAGLAAYRGADLRRMLRDEFNAAYSLSGVYALLHRLDLSNLVPRPQHPDGDADAQAAFKKYVAGQAGRSSARASG